MAINDFTGEWVYVMRLFFVNFSQFRVQSSLTGCGCTWSWRFQWNFALLQRNRAAI